MDKNRQAVVEGLKVTLRRCTSYEPSVLVRPVDYTLMLCDEWGLNEQEITDIIDGATPQAWERLLQAVENAD